MQSARSGNCRPAIDAAAPSWERSASTIASWFSNAHASTSWARSSAQIIASLIAHAPGWIASPIIQLHASSSGNNSMRRDTFSAALTDSNRSSKPRHAGHNGSRISITGTTRTWRAVRQQHAALVVERLELSARPDIAVKIRRAHRVGHRRDPDERNTHAEGGAERGHREVGHGETLGAHLVVLMRARGGSARQDVERERGQKRHPTARVDPDAELARGAEG